MPKTRFCHYFPSATDKVLDKAAEHCGLNTSDAEMMDMEDVREDADKAPCPFSKSRKMFVYPCLCSLFLPQDKQKSGQIVRMIENVNKQHQRNLGWGLGLERTE